MLWQLFHYVPLDNDGWRRMTEHHTMQRQWEVGGEKGQRGARLGARRGARAAQQWGLSAPRGREGSPSGLAGRGRGRACTFPKKPPAAGAGDAALRAGPHVGKEQHPQPPRPRPPKSTLHNTHTQCEAQTQSPKP